MFKLSRNSLEGKNLLRTLSNRRAGAFVAFEGRVRVTNRQRRVSAIEYEASVRPAKKEFEKIVMEIRRNYKISDLRCVHRVGRVRVGEVAVWIGVTAVHRGAAFAACQMAIDLLKNRLPIWKKEHYKNGSSNWLD